MREVSVVFSDGNFINTSMAAHLSDDEIRAYYKIGSKFNLGKGGRDWISEVREVYIYN